MTFVYSAVVFGNSPAVEGICEAFRGAECYGRFTELRDAVTILEEASHTR